MRATEPPHEMATTRSPGAHRKLPQSRDTGSDRNDLFSILTPPVVIELTPRIPLAFAHPIPAFSLCIPAFPIQKLSRIKAFPITPIRFENKKDQEGNNR